MTSNTPCLEFKTTGDERHDLETYIEDLIDYCLVQNWYDISKENEAAKWTNHDSRIRKNSNHDPRGKKLPKHASRKKVKGTLLSITEADSEQVKFILLNT